MLHEQMAGSSVPEDIMWPFRDPRVFAYFVEAAAAVLLNRYFTFKFLTLRTS